MKTDVLTADLRLEMDDGQTVFAVDKDDDLMIEFPQDFSDLDRGVARNYLTLAQAKQLRDFLNGWLS